jgi:hypothetical protein
LATELTSEQEAVIVSASEDYLCLGEAEFEAPRAAIIELLKQGFVQLLEIEQDDRGTRELRSFDINEDSMAILHRSESWVPPLERGSRFYAIFATEKGQKAFRRIVGVKP